MLELRKHGYSYHKIAEILTTMGIPTKNRRPKWRATTVMKILKAHGIQSNQGEAKLA
jgi:hypothetical protein